MINIDFILAWTARSNRLQRSSGFAISMILGTERGQCAIPSTSVALTVLFSLSHPFRYLTSAGALRR